MQRIKEFVKKNYLLIIIAGLLFYIVSPKTTNRPLYSEYDTTSYGSTGVAIGAPSAQVSNFMGKALDMMPSQESTNVEVSSQDRKKIENYDLNIAVSSVQESIQKLEIKTISLGGFVVNSSYTKPAEAENGYITIRIPVTKKTEFLNYVKENSVKVVSEYANGDDVTDSYKDINQRLTILEDNKARFEEIMKKAEKIEDILRVQSEIFNLQNQIDSLLGQKQYIDRTSSTIRYSINLSTDEYAFSYLPKDGWEPKAVFKEAVRHLVLNIRGLANRAIWALVYSVLWLPILVIAFVVYKKYWYRK